MSGPFIYKTHGTCSQFIEVELDSSRVIRSVIFTGGCNGNLQGIAQLVRGMKAEEAIAKLDGIRCGTKNTSCPDQLCRALQQAIDASPSDSK